MRLKQAIKNILHIILSAIGAILGVWLTYKVTYSFPLALILTIVFTIYACFVLSLNLCAMALSQSISYSQYRKATFIATNRKINALPSFLTTVLLLVSVYFYKSAIKKFDDKELKQYGKRSIAIVYKYHYPRKGPRKRHIDYYYKVGNRNYEGNCISNIRKVGDTLVVIYSTHIPQIHTLVYPSTTF